MEYDFEKRTKKMFCQKCGSLLFNRNVPCPRCEIMKRKKDFKKCRICNKTISSSNEDDICSLCLMAVSPDESPDESSKKKNKIFGKKKRYEDDDEYYNHNTDNSSNKYQDDVSDIEDDEFV